MSGRVPPSSRAKARRASNPTLGDAARRAALIYERFTGHYADEAQRVNFKVPRAVAEIGTCDGILYTTVRDGKTEHYKHEFAATDKPLMCVSEDGRQLLLIGGRYKFTARGIVDTSDKSK
jgi:hypothetical protein